MAEQASPASTQALSWLRDMPINVFASTMGIIGLGLVWRQGAVIWPSIAGASSAILLLGAAMFVGFTALTAVRFALFPSTLTEDLNHPIRMNFFSAFAISLLLLARAVQPYDEGAAVMFWGIGAIVSASFALRTMRYWLTHSIDPNNINPTWFVPVVGNLVVPIIGADLGFANISWAFFALGFGSWLTLQPVMLYRLIVQEKLPVALLPTLFIFISPPGLMASALMGLLGPQAALLAVLPFVFGLFLFCVLLLMTPEFMTTPFTITWWSYTFPMHAMTMAAFVLMGQSVLPGLDWIWRILFCLTSLVTLNVLVQAAWRSYGILRK